MPGSPIHNRCRQKLVRPIDNDSAAAYRLPEADKHAWLLTSGPVRIRFATGAGMKIARYEHAEEVQLGLIDTDNGMVTPLATD